MIYQAIFYNVRPYISEFQHGFLPGRSTVSNLACFSQFVSETLDKQGQVDVIYTDFSKAFDVLDHNILLMKLSQLGAAPCVLELLRSYLHNRISYVYYNGFSSSEFLATSGVPQGSILGPLLFLVFINDLLSSLSVHVLAYADDLKLFSRITLLEDAERLQCNFNKVVKWCENYNLPLNISKCHIMSYVRKKTVVVFNYHFKNVPLSRVSEIMDLGVTFSSNFNFDKHIDILCTSASQMLGLIFRLSADFHNIDVIKVLYFAFVISRLEYASLIWYPYYSCQKLLVDRVHRRFLKFLSFKMDGQYPQRGTCQDELLRRHNFPSLEHRREFHSAIFLQKLIKNKIDSPFLLSKINFYVPRTASRYSSAFYQDVPRTNVLRRAPVNIMCKNADIHLTDIFE